MAEAQRDLGRVFLTPTEVAAELRMAVQTLADWRYRRRGPKYYKFGGRILYRREHIDEWIAAQTIDPQGSAYRQPDGSA